MRTLIWLFIAVAITLPWMFFALSGQGHHLAETHPAQVSLLAGISIIGAAFILSWGTELAERICDLLDELAPQLVYCGGHVKRLVRDVAAG